MLGDWVFLSDKGRYPMRVISIDESTCYLDFDENEGDPFDGIYGEGGIAPIPLTKEIIWLNNAKWIQNNEIAPFWYEGESFYCGCFGGYKLEVKYVHEVQNFLRVVGFKEEANKFRIK